MFDNSIGRKVSTFLRNKSGDFAVQSALMFAALAIVGALFAAPALDKATRNYASNGSLGIDPITTASTRQSEPRRSTYTIRKSVLSDKEEILCRTASGRGC